MNLNKNNSLIIAIVALLLFNTTGALYATEEGEPHSWLTRMSNSIRTLTYEGSFIYQQGNQLHAMEIIHTQTEDGEFERLTSLTGIQRDVFRSDNLVTCILPDSRSVIVERNDQLLKGNLPVSLPELDRIMQFYSIELKETARIAGRHSQRVDVIPRDKLRYTHSFWIDINTGMLLKYALFDGQGEVIEWFMFTNIGFPAEIPLNRFKPEIQEKDFIWYQNDKNGSENSNPELNQWQAANLPPGFQQLQHRRQYKYPDPRPVEHMVFSDGMSTVSVFIEKLEPEEESLIGPNRIGAISTYGQVIDGYQITAVGEVPMATVMAISNSIHKG